MPFQTASEAAAAWAIDKPRLEEAGAYFPEAVGYVFESHRHNWPGAMDAQPALSTTTSSGIPSMLTTLIDPEVYKVLFAPNKAAVIFDERRKGGWTDDTTVFAVIEHTGEVSSYGDYNENGAAGANTNWPQRQSYLFQTMQQYGEREIERMGLGRINWVAEQDKAAATVLNKFANLTYFFGVQGLQNFGLLNDPNLSAALTPATKAYGGVKWINAGAIVATANEVYADIQAMLLQLKSQTGGLIENDSPMVLAMSPTTEMAMTATNSFNVNVSDLLKKSFPNIRIETAVQYGVASASNPNGAATGNEVQLIAKSIEGQDTGYCAFNEKMRAHPIIRGTSSWRKKVTGGTWGAVIRMPMAISSMIGV